MTAGMAKSSNSLALTFMRGAFGLLLLSLAWLIVHIIRHPQVTFFEDRLPGILHQAELIPPGGVVVVGDSIAATNYIPTLCGRPALNAGIGGASSKLWAPHLQDLLKRARPSIVIIALGENDDENPHWKDDYRRIAKFGTFAVTPKEADRAAFIRSVLPSVPVPSQTIDGIHMNIAGSREWVRRVEAQCKRMGLS